MIDGEALAQFMREQAADMLALIPPVRRCADTKPAHHCADALVRAAYGTLRTAENIGAYSALCEILEGGSRNYAQNFADEAKGAKENRAKGDCAAQNDEKNIYKPQLLQPFCITGVTTAFLTGAAGICRSAKIRLSGCRAPLWCAGSARLYAVCLGNVICNSILYGDEKVNITISINKTDAPQNKVRIIIRDNGKGMLPQTAENAFAPFASFSPYGDEPAARFPALSGDGGGLGLGLAIASAYAKACGGTFAVQSDFGRGTCAALSLPLVPFGSLNFARKAPPRKNISAKSNNFAAEIKSFNNNFDAAGTAKAAHSSRHAANMPRASSRAAAYLPDFAADRFSTLYTQLSPVCDLPL